ncbi:MAG: HAD-IIA family hydrolase [Candidatus Devosia phytovorans]|uniref:HAD-IIA family hydrolase n=1 Tax=Candidatus Devosia phytovorans TaxID=3121372 RepID=A0AAJ5VUD8_9HYPH|nr:HAD-IIA family hydrolase [Devosia sp.]WEK03767.1 MAG: HAD-IIA family hydrolase [Devosia sp.]
MSVTTRRLGSIDELSFSAVLSDLDGVVYRGDEAVPGAVERFNRWQSEGIPYCFVTNNAEKSAAAFAEKIERLGIACTPQQVVTSGDVALDFVQAKYAPGAGLYVIGTQAFKARVADCGFVLMENDAAAVIVALDRGFDYAMMTTALRNILGGADLIGTNPDLIRPLADGFEPGAGAITASIAAASSATPIFMGKPDPTIIHTAIARLGVCAADAIMIGDKLDTDILAGQRAGVTSIFMETGVPLDTRSLVVPDYLLASL